MFYPMTVAQLGRNMSGHSSTVALPMAGQHRMADIPSRVSCSSRLRACLHLRAPVVSTHGRFRSCLG